MNTSNPTSDMDITDTPQPPQQPNDIRIEQPQPPNNEQLPEKQFDISKSNSNQLEISSTNKDTPSPQLLDREPGQSSNPVEAIRKSIDRLDDLRPKSTSNYNGSVSTTISSDNSETRSSSAQKIYLDDTDKNEHGGINRGGAMEYRNMVVNSSCSSNDLEGSINNNRNSVCDIRQPDRKSLDDKMAECITNESDILLTNKKIYKRSPEFEHVDTIGRLANVQDNKVNLEKKSYSELNVKSSKIHDPYANKMLYNDNGSSLYNNNGSSVNSNFKGNDILGCSKQMEKSSLNNSGNSNSGGSNSSLYVSAPDFTKQIRNTNTTTASMNLTKLQMKTPDFTKMYTTTSTEVAPSSSHPATMPQQAHMLNSTYKKELHVSPPDFTRGLQRINEKSTPPNSSSQIINSSNFAEISKKYNYISDLQLKKPIDVVVAPPQPLQPPPQTLTSVPAKVMNVNISSTVRGSSNSPYHDLYVKAPDFKTTKMRNNVDQLPPTMVTDYPKPSIGQIEEPIIHVIEKGQYGPGGSGSGGNKQNPQMSNDEYYRKMYQHQQRQQIYYNNNHITPQQETDRPTPIQPTHDMPFQSVPPQTHYENKNVVQAKYDPNDYYKMRNHTTRLTETYSPHQQQSSPNPSSRQLQHQPPVYAQQKIIQQQPMQQQQQQLPPQQHHHENRYYPLYNSSTVVSSPHTNYTVKEMSQSPGMSNSPSNQHGREKSAHFGLMSQQQSFNPCPAQSSTSAHIMRSPSVLSPSPSNTIPKQPSSTPGAMPQQYPSRNPHYSSNPSTQPVATQQSEADYPESRTAVAKHPMDKYPHYKYGSVPGGGGGGGGQMYPEQEGHHQTTSNKPMMTVNHQQRGVDINYYNRALNPDVSIRLAEQQHTSNLSKQNVAPLINRSASSDALNKMYPHEYYSPNADKYPPGSYSTSQRSSSLTRHEIRHEVRHEVLHEVRHEIRHEVRRDVVGPSPPGDQPYSQKHSQHSQPVVYHHRQPPFENAQAVEQYQVLRPREPSYPPPPRKMVDERPVERIRPIMETVTRPYPPAQELPKEVLVKKPANEEMASPSSGLGALDLSVKTVKTKADSTGCDDYRATVTHGSASSSTSLKVDFQPNFLKHTIGPQYFPQSQQPMASASHQQHHQTHTVTESSRPKPVGIEPRRHDYNTAPLEHQRVQPSVENYRSKKSQAKLYNTESYQKYQHPPLIVEQNVKSVPVPVPTNSSGSYKKVPNVPPTPRLDKNSIQYQEDRRFIERILKQNKSANPLSYQGPFQEPKISPMPVHTPPQRKRASEANPPPAPPVKQSRSEQSVKSVTEIYQNHLYQQKYQQQNKIVQDKKDLTGYDRIGHPPPLSSTSSSIRQPVQMQSMSGHPMPVTHSTTHTSQMQTQPLPPPVPSLQSSHHHPHHPQNFYRYPTTETKPVDQYNAHHSPYYPPTSPQRHPQSQTDPNDYWKNMNNNSSKDMYKLTDDRQYYEKYKMDHQHQPPHQQQTIPTQNNPNETQIQHQGQHGWYPIENSMKPNHHHQHPTSSLDRLGGVNTLPVQTQQEFTQQRIENNLDNQMMLSKPPSIQQTQSVIIPPHRGADQHVINKLRNSLEQKEIVKQKLLQKQGSVESIHNTTNDDEESSSQQRNEVNINSPANRILTIRTKGELKGFVPIPPPLPTPPQSTVNLSHLQPLAAVTTTIDSPKMVPDDDMAHHETKAVDPPSDLEGATTLDLMDWGQACTDFVVELQTGESKKRDRKRKNMKNKNELAKVNKVQTPSIDERLNNDWNSVENNNVEVVNDTTKKSCSSDEDKPLNLLRKQGGGSLSDLGASKKTESNNDDSQSSVKQMNRNSIFEKLTEKIERNLKEKQRLDREKRLAAQLGSSSSDGETESVQVQRLRKRFRKPKTRLSVSVKKLSVESSGEEEGVEKTTVNVKKTEDATSTSISTKESTREKGKPLKDRKANDETSSHDESSDDNTENGLSKNDKGKLVVKTTIGGNEKKIDGDENPIDDKKSSKSSSSANNSPLVKSPARKMNSAPATLVPPPEETMTRSKRKREIEQQLSNSKILRNDKIVANVQVEKSHTPKKPIDQKESVKSSPTVTNVTKKSDGIVTRKMSVGKRKNDSDVEGGNKDKEAVKNSGGKKKICRPSKMKSSSEGSSQESDHETVTERLRPRKIKPGDDTIRSLSVDDKSSKKIKDEPKQCATVDVVAKGQPILKTPASKKVGSSKSQNSQVTPTSSSDNSLVKKFPPGWEEDFIEYKRAQRVPPSLITVRSPLHRISTSLPDLDNSSDASECISEKHAKLKEENELKSAVKLARVVAKDKNTSTKIKEESVTLMKTEQGNSVEKKSMIDLLHQRISTQRSLNKEKKLQKTNATKLPPKSNGSELIPTPGVENDNIFSTPNLFETAVLKSRTRTAHRMQKTKEIIREVFGGEDRPASAPPLGLELNSENETTECLTFDQKYTQYLQKINIDFMKKSPTTSTSMGTTTMAAADSSMLLASVKIKRERPDHLDDTDDETTQDTEINAIETGFIQIKEETQESNYLCDTPSIASERGDAMTPSTFQKITKIKRRAKYGSRRKGSSGFDYIRKKKKPTPVNLQNTINDMAALYQKRKIAMTLELNDKDENDLSKEIKGWVLNKGVGESVMHKASRLGYIDAIAYCLIRLNMDPNLKDNAGYTPLHEACSRGHLDIARLLLEYGANHSETAQSGIRPLHEAIENNYIEVVRLLLSYGADPLLATYSGQTPLLLAESDAMTSLLKNHLYDVQNTSPTKSSWKFDGPWKIFDVTLEGFDIFENPPVNYSEITAPNTPQSKNSYSSASTPEFSTNKLITENSYVNMDQPTLTPTPPRNTTAVIKQQSPAAIETVKNSATLKRLKPNENNPNVQQVEQFDSNSNNIIPEAADYQKPKTNLSKIRDRKCSVVLNNIDSSQTMMNQSRLSTSSTVVDGVTTTVVPPEHSKQSRENIFVAKDFDNVTTIDDDCNDLFEFEESENPLPPLYLLKDEGAEKWVLLSDLCNLLKVKSKDTLLKQICPTSPPSICNKELLRELKMTDFLEKATCLQLLCAGEKLNIRSSKVVLVRYNDSVKSLLGVNSITLTL